LFAIGKEDLHGNLFRGIRSLRTNALNLPSDAGSRPGKRTGTHAGHILRAHLEEATKTKIGHDDIPRDLTFW
jgi:hypothetical protein